MTAYLSSSILVVEDSQTTLRIVRGLLSTIGFKNVDHATNGLEALVKMSEKKYDLVLADWNMEPMSGFELLKHVRSDSRLARTRIILMTAESKAEHVLAARKEGANFIGKPFSADALKAKIEGSFQIVGQSA
jgi:two-component system chemotaxis response regulator CheY